MKVKIFTLLAIIYFFFDSVGLALGLRYTIILAPVIFVKILPQYVKVFTYLGIGLSFFFCFHLLDGIESYFEYFKSLTLHFLVFVLCVGFYDKLKNRPDLVGKIIEKITVLNLAFVFVAAVFIIFKFPFYDVIWREYRLASFPQLRLLTYEPSYYSLMVVPLFFYYYTKLGAGVKKVDKYYFVGLVISLLLSRSVGVVAGIVLSLIIATIILEGRLSVKKVITIGTYFFAGLISLLTLHMIFPENYFSERLIAFVVGEDVSGMARIFDPWTLSVGILKQKSYLFGVGWGHVKIYGHDLIIDFYNYRDNNKRVGLPNTVAETYVILGFVGLFLRLGMQFFLYTKTQVNKSRYRSFLFWFMVIYQFTGSFSTNFVEYVIWILAFTKTDYFDNYKFWGKDLKSQENIN